MASQQPHTIEELEAEKRLLIKADADIEQGRVRLRNQEDLLMSLQAAGQNTEQASKLVELMRQTLVEWEHHRVLIEQRVDYLRNKQD